MTPPLPHPHPTRNRPSEAGFTLVAVIVAIFLVLLVLSVAAPRVAQSLHRDRELETIHRGQQYVRAIQLYYRRFGHYPGSLEQLEKSNNIRFLRQRYPDPMTGKPDWRLIHPGEAKTTVKGFFGQPLAGLPTAAGLSGSSPIGSTPTNTGPATFGSTPSPTSSASSTFGRSPGSTSPTFGSSPGSTSAPAGTSAAAATGTDPNSTASPSQTSTGFPSQSASSFSGTGGAFLGIGTSAPGNSITVLNEQTTYPTWEFLYDPRIEQLKSRVNLFGGGMTSAPTGIAGSSPLGTPTPTPSPSPSKPKN